MANYSGDEKWEILTKALGKLIGLFIVFLIDGIILKYIWNSLLVNLFHLSVINYSQALLLIIAAGILFKVKSVQTTEIK
jgi:hypothetical protein